MGLYLRSSSLANPGNSITILPSALSYNQADGNFMYLLTNMSGSNISITGSTSIVGTLTVTGNITGNLVGTSSWATNAISVVSASQATNATSASFASTASYVLNAVSASYSSNADLLDGKNSTIFATTGSNTFIGNQVITGSLTVSGSSTFTNIGNTILTGSLDVSGSGRFVNDIISSGSLYVYNGELEGNVNSIIYKTEIGLTDGIPYIDGNYNGIEPLGWDFKIGGNSVMGFSRNSGANSIAIEGATRITTGGLIVTGSLNTSGSGKFTNGLTVTGSLNVSGSNTLIGTKIITGSVFISGSKTIIGTNIVTGSMLISGSTTQTGNNTLIGNTTLSGSINVSGSQTFYGTSAFYGNHTLSGSNTITGNTILSGSIEVSGSSNFRNSVFIVTGSSYFKGTHDVSGSTNVTGSLNITGDLNVISGSGFYRWGNRLFNYAQFANTASITVTQNVSGAFALPLTYFGDGISIVSGSRITFANTGLYNIQFSTLATQGNASATAHIWFRKTGSNIDNSDTSITLQNNTTVPLAWNFLYPFSASEYAEILYHSNSTVTSFTYAAAGSGFPASPSIIVTVTQVA